MKNILITIGIALTFFIVFSCSDDSDEHYEELINLITSDTSHVDNSEEQNYYVKYEVTIYPTNYVVLSTINVAIETGTQSFDIDPNGFSETFGPVKKGFTASIDAYLASQANNKEFAIRIYTCKGNEPFVLKAYNYSTEDSRNTPLTARYTIDY